MPELGTEGQGLLSRLNWRVDDVRAIVSVWKDWRVVIWDFGGIGTIWTCPSLLELFKNHCVIRNLGRDSWMN
jgi:hypothetical protein